MVSKIDVSMLQNALEIGDYCISARSSKSKWLKCDGTTVGSLASGATALAAAEARDLFNVLWDSFANAELPIQDSAGGASTRGASADADFDADKRMPLPDPRGRAMMAAGSGAGLTARAMGASGGEETHLLTTAEMPSHSHGVTDPGHTHPNSVATTSGSSPGGGAQVTGNATQTVGNATTGITINNQGGGGAHNNMPPYLAVGNLFISAGV